MPVKIMLSTGEVETENIEQPVDLKRLGGERPGFDEPRDGSVYDETILTIRMTNGQEIISVGSAAESDADLLRRAALDVIRS